MILIDNKPYFENGKGEYITLPLFAIELLVEVLEKEKVLTFVGAHTLWNLTKNIWVLKVCIGDHDPIVYQVLPQSLDDLQAALAILLLE